MQFLFISLWQKGLFAVDEDLDREQLLPTVMKVGEINLKCMAFLDKANTETYGHPVPTEVSLAVEKGSFIVISGHDLRDLQLLLKQTEGTVVLMISNSSNHNTGPRLSENFEIAFVSMPNNIQ